MEQFRRLDLAGFLFALGAARIPLYAAVSIVSMTPSAASPQLLGTPVTWTVTATDTNPGPLTFQRRIRQPALRPDTRL